MDNVQVLSLLLLFFVPLGVVLVGVYLDHRFDRYCEQEEQRLFSFPEDGV